LNKLQSETAQFTPSVATWWTGRNMRRLWFWIRSSYHDNSTDWL